VNPVVTKCKHYFCEDCAINHHQKDPRCACCRENTGGTFNVATDIMKKQKKKKKETQAKLAKNEQEQQEVGQDQDPKEPGETQSNEEEEASKDSEE